MLRPRGYAETRALRAQFDRQGRALLCYEALYDDYAICFATHELRKTMLQPVYERDIEYWLLA